MVRNNLAIFIGCINPLWTLNPLIWIGLSAKRDCKAINCSPLIPCFSAIFVASLTNNLLATWTLVLFDILVLVWDMGWLLAVFLHLLSISIAVCGSLANPELG